jgi:hypothetical protein
MNCFKCEHVNETGSKFCSNCGKNFQNKKPHNKVATEHNGQSNTAKNSTYPDETAIQMYEARLKEKVFKPINIWIFTFILLVITFVFCGGQLLPFVFFGTVTLLFPIMALSATKIVTEEFYYTIPTSKDIHDQHHCIFCGHKGIYKSTIYRTSTVVSTCSKCKKKLFQS